MAFTQRKTRDGKLHYVFTYKKPWGPQGKLNFSAYYSSKDTAARAIFAWAGDDWPNRVVCTTTRKPSSNEAPPPKTISMKEPLSPAERLVLRDANFTMHRARNGKEHFVFWYKQGWGPGNLRGMSKYYNTKAAAARAIYRWAGEDWATNVRSRPKTMALVKETETVQEAQITCPLRSMRATYLRWLQKTVTLALVKQDHTGEVLANVEDDKPSRELSDLAAKDCGEVEFQECLEQALKCETDSWPGPVVYLGPKALDAMLKPFNACIKIFLLEDLSDKQHLPPPGYGLVLHRGHFIPFWNDAFHGQFTSRPWVSGPMLEFTKPWQEVASKLDCYLDVTTRASGDCLPHGAMVLLQMLHQKPMHLVPGEAEVQEEFEEVEPLPLQAHSQVGLGLWSIGMIHV